MFVKQGSIAAQNDASEVETVRARPTKKEVEQTN